MVFEKDNSYNDIRYKSLMKWLDEIEKDEKIGFMNNEGHIVIPPIFPKDVQTGIDEETSNEAWKEYQKYSADSVSDAYEGLEDAHWNTD